MLDTLAAPNHRSAFGRHFSQKGADERGFPYTGLTSDKDELAFTRQRPIEQLVQSFQLRRLSRPRTGAADGESGRS